MRFTRRMTGLLALGALAWTALAPNPGQAQTPDEIIKRGKVVIAIDTTTPPYAFLDANNQHVPQNGRARVPRCTRQ